MISRSKRVRRPGGFARREGRKRYLELLAAVWRQLIVFGVVWYSLTVYLHARYGYSDIVFGILLISPLWATSVVLVGDAGAASWMSGATGEEWTSQALRKQLNRTWTVVNDVQLARGNVDHIVVGAAGVYCIETKWSSKPWASSRGSGRILQASKQATANARAVRHLLADQGIDVSTTAVVVLWGGRTRHWSESKKRSDLHKVPPVVTGAGLKDWIATLLTAEPLLDNEAAKNICATLLQAVQQTLDDV